MPRSNAPPPRKLQVSGQTGLIERGDLLLPSAATWLDQFEHELLAFPRARHDDQVDALVHLLA